MAGIGAIAVMALVGGTALSVRAYTAVIEPQGVITQNILLKDGSGRVRVALNNTGQLSLYDANGKTRVWMDATGGLAQLYDANGALRTRILPGAVQAVDAYGKVRASLDGEGALKLYNYDGKMGAMTSSGGFYLLDSNGKSRIILIASDNKIYFYNASGGIVAAHP